MAGASLAAAGVVAAVVGLAPAGGGLSAAPLRSVLASAGGATPLVTAAGAAPRTAVPGPRASSAVVPLSAPAGAQDAARDATPAPEVTTGAPSAPAPTEVVVPSLGIDSPLVHLGLMADGTLAVPTDFGVAGWFADGPAPGASGPAVIAGHLDSTAGPAVFARLKELRVGDQVLVRRADGSTAAFAVTGSVQVAKSAFPTDAVYGPVADAQLRLITCGGVFDRRTGHYVDNVVVFARLV